MIYCEGCGAANDIMAQQCHRCGRPLPQDEFASLSVAPAAAAVVRPVDTPGAALGPADMSGPVLGASLDLPDWLKAAAAATPETPPAPAATPSPSPSLPPAGFQVAAQSAPIGTNELFGRAAEPAPPEPVAPPRQLPPVPAPGIAEGLPDWLRPAATHVPRAHMPSDEHANPASFISENDLPEWIRQIAAADEAKRREDERIAAEAAATEAAAKRAALPGESAAAAAANPWLTRREPTGATGAWGAAKSAAPAAMPPVFAEDEAPEVIRVEPELAPAAAEVAPETGKRAKLAKPQVSVPKLSAPKLSLPKMALPKPSAAAPDAPAAAPGGREAMLRYGLIAAVVLLLLIVLLAVVL